MIAPPSVNPRRAGMRVIAESLAQATPLTAGIAHLYQFTHPSEMERAVEAWRGDVSAALNAHEDAISQLQAQIAPRLRISETALDLALWLTETSIDGLSTPIEFTSALAAFEGTDKGLLEEACHELEHLDLVTLSAAIGRPVLGIRPTYDLFWTFDPAVAGTSPSADAVIIARLMLDDDAMASIPALHKHLEWPKRRLNPAVARLMPLVAEGRTRSVIQNDYPTLAFALAAEDRFRLRRFVEDATQDTQSTAQSAPQSTD